MSAVAPRSVCSLFHHNLRPFSHYTVSELRNKLIDRIDVLNKVKELFLIPSVNAMTTAMIADFYEVDVDTIRRVWHRNHNEILSDGVSKQLFKEFRAEHLVPSKIECEQIKGKKPGISTYRFGTHVVEFNNASNILFSPRAVLRIGMLLRDSEVAKEVRTQLLNTFENLLYVLYK